MKQFINTNIKPIWVIWVYAAVVITYMTYTCYSGNMLLGGNNTKWEKGSTQHK